MALVYDLYVGDYAPDVDRRPESTWDLGVSLADVLSATHRALHSLEPQQVTYVVVMPRRDLS